MSGRRVAIILKTGSGGMWILPQVEALRAEAEVVVVIPNERGRLSEHLDALAADDPGITVHRTDYGFRLSPRPSNLRDLWRFVRELRALHLDAALYHLYASALVSRLALVGSGVRRVQMVAGPLHLESPVIRIVERVLQRMDDVIICGSEDIRRRYLEIGVAPRKLITIPYGVNTQAFSPSGLDSRDTVRDSLGVQPDAFLVAMVAFVYPPKRMVHAGKGIKGHAELLAAWDMFSRDHPAARLMIVGGGFQHQGEIYRKQIIDSLPRSLESMGVTWLNTVDDVRTLYEAADLSVSPSLSENHGAALEASAMGKPSIVSNAGGLPETVVPDESGWIVQAGDANALRTALERAHARWLNGTLGVMGDRAREVAVREFDSRDAARSVAEVLLGGRQ